MTMRITAYRGDAELRKRLEDAHAFYCLPDLKELIRGVNAAPVGHDPAAWMALVAPKIPEDLAAQLAALARVLSAAEPGETLSLPQRLTLLRKAMADEGIDALLVPHHDEFHHEEIPASSRRLEWITGFSGSAGLAVILAGKSALFIDGRYTLQAKAETGAADFDIFDFRTEAVRDYLAEHVPPAARIGYDAALMTEGDLAVLPPGHAFTATSRNLVDAVWTTRPPEPVAPVSIRDTAFAGETAESKITRMAEALTSRGISAALLTRPDSIAWLLNLRGGDVPYAPLPRAFAILHAKGRVSLFIDRRKLASGVEVHLGDLVETRAMADLPASCGILDGKVLAEAATIPVAIAKAMPNASIVWGDDPCQLPKAIKNAAEREGARRAHLRDGAALCRFMAWFADESGKGALTEGEAARIMLEFRKEEDLFRGESFAAISAFGPNAAMPHYHAEGDGSILGHDGLFLLDSGGQYLDGTTDVTRAFAVGVPADAAKADYTRVLSGVIALSDAVFPAGTSGLQLDALARKALWRAGADYAHGTGHGIGSYLCVHEGPARISKRGASQALLPGMLLSCEPGCYRENAYGIRIENVMLVAEHPDMPGWLRFETLTLAPFERALIVPEMLEKNEIAWINAYHARVLEAIFPRVSEKTGAWLRMATRPL